MGNQWKTAMLPVVRAGVCPAGRYQVLLAYLLLFPGMQWMKEGFPRLWRQRLLWTLCLTGVVSAVILWKVGLAPNYWFRLYHPLFGYAMIQNYYGWLPSPESRWFLPHCAVWLAAFAALLFTYDIGSWACEESGRRAGAKRIAPRNRRCLRFVPIDVATRSSVWRFTCL